ncbi:hypothetical protein GC169_12010 [bacterium]|nr:hypothetical protein [bacterium]
MSDERTLGRGRTQTISAAAPAPADTEAGAAARQVTWIALLALGGLSTALGAMAAFDSISDFGVTRMDDASFRSELASPSPNASVDWLEYASERALALSPPDLEASRRMSALVLDADPSRAFTWARLAYLDWATDREMTPAAVSALDRSIQACPMCDDALVRWRLEFALANWDAVPEATRRAAFMHMAALPDTTANVEFTASARIRSNAAGIPFDAYLDDARSPASQ